MAHALFSSPLGTCGIAWSEAGLSGLRLPEADEAKTETKLKERTGSKAKETPPRWVAELVEDIQRHLEGSPRGFEKAKIDWSCTTPFRRRVYEAARALGAGETCSYGRLALQLGLKPGAARAVGQALGANPWVLVVPCHRILGAAGKLHGFSAAGGIETKAKLLDLEGASYSV